MDRKALRSATASSWRGLLAAVQAVVPRQQSGATRRMRCMLLSGGEWRGERHEQKVKQ